MHRRAFLVSTAALALGAPAWAVEPVDAGRVPERVRRCRGAVLVHVWATWCGPCKKAFPYVNEAAAHYGPRGLSVLAFAIDTDPAVVERYEAANHAQWTGHVVAGGRGLATAIDALGGRYGGSIPYDLLLDAKGRVVSQWSGGLGREPLRARIQQALAGGLPAPPASGPVASVEQGRVRIVLEGREGDPVSIDGWTAGALPLDTELVGGAHLFRVDGPSGRIQVEVPVELVTGGVVEIDLAAASSAADLSTP